MRETRTAQMSIFDSYSKHERSETLQALSALLDEHRELLGLVEPDLLNKNAKATGSKGLSVESIFRCLLLKQITRASYEQLSFLLADSRSYRTFARLDRQSSPCKSTLCANIRRLRPETLELVFEQLNMKIDADGELETDLLRLRSTRRLHIFQSVNQPSVVLNR